MPDSRDVDQRKYAPMTPAAFQALQPSSASDPSFNPASSSSLPLKRRRDAVEQATREREPVRVKTRRYRAEDFHYSSSMNDKVDAWFLQYPALRKRNFYTIQNHHATAKHFDLRLHISGTLFSLAIPRGLSPHPHKSTSSSSTTTRGVTQKLELARLAVETSLHPLNYALFEGVGRTGVTAIWDIGEYRVHLTKKKERKRDQLQKQGLDDGDTTESSEVEESEVDDEDSRSLDGDEKQEELLRKAIERSSFSAGTLQPEKQRRKLESKMDGGETRGFVLELIGERYKGLRFTLARNSSQFETVKRKTTGVLYRSPRWYCILHDPSGSLPLSRTENSAISSTQSLLTGRTMEEIGIAGGWEKPSAKAEREKKELEMVDTTDEEEEGNGRGERETQGLIDVEGDELRWFEARGKRKVEK
ncbi:uncharacterized protein JCM6883_007157 [Sporobolomyces salmoneus]|uniref:uncharacterized protein n=1 Tax=Sporobolomyces salmoneus TaxID=183962 RepID=UPI0031812C66